MLLLYTSLNLLGMEYNADTETFCQTWRTPSFQARFSGICAEGEFVETIVFSRCLFAEILI